MNGYKAFFNGRTVEVCADTILEAQSKAAVMFKAKKSYQVTVVLCELAGEQVIHTPSE
jgi:hypothetical protein